VTKTKGGARLVRKWLRQPLLSRVDLEQRYDLVDARTRGREPTTAAWEPLGNQRAVAAAVAAAAAVVAASAGAVAVTAAVVAASAVAVAR
jgi:hypothetical protein